MTEKDKDESGPLVIFMIVVAAVFYFLGIWAGIISIVIGFVVLGWSKRHQGPFPTNKREE